MMNLTLKQKIILRINQRVFLHYEKRTSWLDYLPIYAFKCKKHGLVENRPQGFSDDLDCPKCLAEESQQQ